MTCYAVHWWFLVLVNQCLLSIFYVDIKWSQDLVTHVFAFEFEHGEYNYFNATDVSTSQDGVTISSLIVQRNAIPSRRTRTYQRRPS